MAGPSTRSRSTEQLIEAVTTTLAPVARAAGFDLEAVEVVPAGRRRVLRLVVDCDGGVDLDGIALASSEFSRSLDATDVMGELAYVLEVTSPGVDRPLSLPRHWRRAVGRVVEAPLHDGGTVRARVLAADETTVTFDVDGSPRVIDLPDLGDGRTQLEFERSGGGAA
ncbi:MAG: ribosome maturation factor RimP [Actinomycetes bacterium]